jgi:hypothetical protein
LHAAFLADGRDFFALFADSRGLAFLLRRQWKIFFEILIFPLDFV